MIYELTHYIQKKIPFIWELVEWGNAALFQLRYGRRDVNAVLEKYPCFVEVEESDVPELVRFFAAQPAEAFRFFRPHKFDGKTLRKLQRRKAFLSKMVDMNSLGRGVGPQMCLCAMDIAQAMGLRMYETISKENIASLRSTEKVPEVCVVEEMDNGYLYLEEVRRKSPGLALVDDFQFVTLVEGRLYAA